MIAHEPYGVLPGGTAVELYTIANGHGLQVGVITYGAIIASIRMPDRDGRVSDVVLGCDTLDDYRRQSAYLGAVVGRYANRIREGRFTVAGRSHQLSLNDGPNHLHGGPGGFHTQAWQAEAISVDGDSGVLLSRVSPAGEEHYPGTLPVSVQYIVRRDNVLQIDFVARTDAPTIVNVAQHTYFNLGGDPARAILAHELSIDADAFTPVDDTMIPTGVLQGVQNTPFDFREPTAIGTRIDAPDEQLRRARGYDHNWVLRHAAGSMGAAARLRDPHSGRTLTVHTTEPGVQFYSGNLLDGSTTGRGGVRYERYAGLCLETQRFPDAPNQPAFPSPVLEPGDMYHARTTWSFDVRGAN